MGLAQRGSTMGGLQRASTRAKLALRTAAATRLAPAMAIRARANRA